MTAKIQLPRYTFLFGDDSTEALAMQIVHLHPWAVPIHRQDNILSGVLHSLNYAGHDEPLAKWESETTQSVLNLRTPGDETTVGHLLYRYERFLREHFPKVIGETHFSFANEGFPYTTTPKSIFYSWQYLSDAAPFIREDKEQCLFIIKESEDFETPINKIILPSFDPPVAMPTLLAVLGASSEVGVQ